MERKSNITIWQLRLFEGLNKDIMVMQRNEEEVFDDAIHAVSYTHLTLPTIA